MSKRRYYNVIYKAFNPLENKYYIGQSTFSMTCAKSRHKRKALVLNQKSPFYDAIRKYGFDIFEWETVCYCDTKEELNTKESETIGTIGIDNCYNCYSGGKRKYHNLSEESRHDISIRMTGESNHQYGKKRTAEEMKKCKDASMKVCSKKVIKIETGEIYNSISECARQNNCSIGLISLHCNNKVKTQKYHFL